MSLFTRIKPKEHPTLEKVSTILLDTSGSMGLIDQGLEKRRIDLLRDVIEMLEDIRGIQLYAFDSYTRPVESASLIPEPRGSTNMADAFRLARTKGTHHILVTDGQPDSLDSALREAAGMTFDIVYIGPEPMPSFLLHLARVSSGTLQIGKLQDPKLLAQKISGLLENK